MKKLIILIALTLILSCVSVMGNSIEDQYPGFSFTDSDIDNGIRNSVYIPGYLKVTTDDGDSDKFYDECIKRSESENHQEGYNQYGNDKERYGEYGGVDYAYVQYPILKEYINTYYVADEYNSWSYHDKEEGEIRNEYLLLTGDIYLDEELFLREDATLDGTKYEDVLAYVERSCVYGCVYEEDKGGYCLTERQYDEILDKDDELGISYGDASEGTCIETDGGYDLEFSGKAYAGEGGENNAEDRCNKESLIEYCCEGDCSGTATGELGIGSLINSRSAECSRGCAYITAVTRRLGDLCVPSTDNGISWAEEYPTECYDGIDNDENGKVDLDDSACISWQTESEFAVCNDGIDNDADGQIDTLGGCDLDGDEKLSINLNTGHVNWPVTEVGVGFDTCEQHNGIWFGPDNICEISGQDHYSESIRDTTAPTKTECNDGIDNDGDGTVDYNRGYDGCCDVDNDADGKITGGACESKAYSEIADEWVIEYDITESECSDIYGTGSGSTTPIASNTGSKSFFSKFFGYVIFGNAVKNTNSMNLPTTSDGECETDDDCAGGEYCSASGYCSTGSAGGTQVGGEITETTAPTKSATWYDYDWDCKSSSDDSEQGTQAMATTQNQQKTFFQKIFSFGGN
ncbi:MAG: hypothetical protein ABIJ18_02450 [archaeon]